MTATLQPVVLAGGSGTRLWPASRKLMPKQFLRLLSDRSMLQETLERISIGGDVLPPILLCGEEHRFLAAQQLQDAGVERHTMILEPAGRGTAVAAALAAFASIDAGTGDSVLAVLSADHQISDRQRFAAALRHGAELAEDGHLVVFGIPPTEPVSAYGYIVGGEPFRTAQRVTSFVEKPERTRAAKLIAAGSAYWNSGMFLFTARAFLDELKAFRPDIHHGVAAAWGARRRDLDFTRPGREAFLACPSDAIDTAVMERTQRAVVVPGDFGWSDIGSWDALWQASAKDAEGNATSGDVNVSSSKGCYVRSESRLVSVLGLSDTVVVETADAVLVASRALSQQVKETVAEMERAARNESVSHLRVFRPWGSYQTIDDGERFLVKRITVEPGQSLSLQYHRHRAEHWVVVSGSAKVTRGDEVFILEKDQSTYIPVGMKHRLENAGREPLHLIEIQTGAVLSEDDIVRLEDRYRRTEGAG
jgi:mannose-1-phosphate guanylyltransferase/mannose-6-phosphate isomerase